MRVQERYGITQCPIRESMLKALKLEYVTAHAKMSHLSANFITSYEP